MIAAYFRWVVAHPWLVLLAGIAVTAASAVGVTGLGFTTDYDAYFSPENPEWKAYQSIEKDFARSRSVFYAVAPESNGVFQRQILEAVRTLTDRAWDLPYVKSVGSLTNFHQIYAEGDELVIEPIVPEGELTPGRIAQIRDEAMANDRLQGGLLAEDGEMAGISVAFELPKGADSRHVREIVSKARALSDEIESEYPVTLYQTGTLMFNQAMLDSIGWDLSHLYPPFFIIMFLVLAVFFRSLTATLATLGVLVMSVALTFGAAGWVGVVLTTASVSAGIIILTLAIADCVHVLVTFASARAEGREKGDAMLESLRINAQPILLTSLTTALGFLGMNLSDSPPFRDLGNMVAVGVLGAWAFSMSVLPAAMQVLPLGKPQPRRASVRALRGLAELVIERRRRFLVGMGLVIVVLAACIPLNRFGDNYIEFFDYSLEFRRHTELINRELTGMQSIEYPIEAASAGGVQDPEFLRRLEAFTQWYRDQEGVRRVVSVVDLIERLNKAMHGGDPAYERIPDSRELVAQLLFFYEMSLPQGIDVTHLVNLDKSAARVNVVLNPIPDQDMLELDKRAQAWMQDNLPPDMRAPGSSISIMFAHIARHNFGSMLVGTSLAFAFIALVMIFAFGRLRLGLISLVPNLVPLAMGFGVWGLLVGQTGVATSVVASLVLGIVVDDTVHLLSKYRRAREEKGYSPPDAIRDAFTNVGVALWLTSIVLMTGFALMLLSSFAMTEHMGALTAIIIGLALVCDFLFLPPLLLLTDRDPRSR